MKKTKRNKNNPTTFGDETSGIPVSEHEILGNAKAAMGEQQYLNRVLGVFQPDEDFDRERSESNAQLLQLVAQYLMDYPHLRFGQALKNLDLATEDAALVEPKTQVMRAKTALRKMKS